MKLHVVNEANAHTDWSVGYLDGHPAVGGDGAWYFASKDVAVRNECEGFVWHLDCGHWTSCHVSAWTQETTPSDSWTAGGPDYVEPGTDEDDF